MTRQMAACVVLVVVFVLVLTGTASPALATKRRAFVTSTSGSAKLSTWPGAPAGDALFIADSICQSRATAGGLPNPGGYRAWLSTSTTDAWCHVQGFTGTRNNGCSHSATQKGGGPWYLANGISIFSSDLLELTGPEQKIYRGVLQDEYQHVPTTPREYWTGTLYDGRADNTVGTCLDWTSLLYQARVGHSFSSAVHWTDYSQASCAGTAHLLCLETGASETIAIGFLPSAVVFTTSAVGKGDLSSWPQAQGNSGIDAGDQICRTLAGNAGLPDPGSYFAWLSDSTQDAKDRITLPDLTAFRRLDGIPIAGSVTALLDGAISESMHLDEYGHTITSGPLIPSDLHAWTGTDGFGVGTGVDCQGWTSPGSDKGTTGVPAVARLYDWTDDKDIDCSAPIHLYCIQNAVTNFTPSIFADGFESGSIANWSASVP